MSINNPIIGQVLSSDGDYLETFSVTGNVEGNIELTSVFESKVELGNVYSNADGNGTDYYSANYTFTYTGRHGEDIADSNARGTMNILVDEVNVTGDEFISIDGPIDDNNVRASIQFTRDRVPPDDPTAPLLSSIYFTTPFQSGPTWNLMRVFYQPNSEIYYGLPETPYNPTLQRTNVQYWYADVEYANANVLFNGPSFIVQGGDLAISANDLSINQSNGNVDINFQDEVDINFQSGANITSDGNINIGANGNESAVQLVGPIDDNNVRPSIWIGAGRFNNDPNEPLISQINISTSLGPTWEPMRINHQPNSRILYGLPSNLNPTEQRTNVQYWLADVAYANANVSFFSSQLQVNQSNITLANDGSSISIPGPDRFKLQGGSPNQVLITDGSGNLTWGSGGGASVGTLQEVTGQGNTTTVNLTTANIVTNTDGNDGSGLVYGTLRNYLAGTPPRDGVAYYGSGGFLELSTSLRFPTPSDVNFLQTNHDHYSSSTNTSVVSQRKYTTGLDNPFREIKSLTNGITDSTNNPVRANQSIHQELFTVQSDVDGTPEQQSVANYHHRVGNVVTIGTTDYQGLWANVTFEGRHGLSTSEVPNAKGIYNFENWDEVRINDGTLIAGTATIEKLEATSKINLRPHTVAELEAMSPIAGDKAMCSDSMFSLNSSSVGATVQSGGSFVVPVYYDGLSWKIG